MRYDEGMSFPLNKLEFPSPKIYRQMNTRMTASSVEGHSEKKSLELIFSSADLRN